MEAMSSFRIDRQYVSFVSAETESVYDGQAGNTDLQNAAAAARAEEREAAIRQSAEILAQARREAEIQAELILKQAQTEADTVIRQARQTADSLIQEADGKVAAIREDARQEGQAAGRQQAEEEATEKKRGEAREFQRLEENLQKKYADLLNEMQESILSLIMDIVKKVINVRLKKEKILLNFVEDALEQLKQAGFVTIHISQADYARYFGEDAAEKYQLPGNTDITVVAEEGYEEGDLLAESEGEVLDYRIGGQLDRIEKAFRQEGDQPS